MATKGASIITTDELRKLREDLVSGKKGEAAREAAILN